jgi:ribosomal protein S19
MKIPFVSFDLYSKVFKEPLTQTSEDDMVTSESSVIRTASRSSTIISPFVGKTIAVYNGKRPKHIDIKPEMIGYKLGCFVFTKKLGVSIHNSEHNRKKIAKMRRKITQKKVRKTAAGKAKGKKPSSKKKKK